MLVKSDRLLPVLRRLGFSDDDLRRLLGRRKLELTHKDTRANGRVKQLLDILSLAGQVHGKNAKAWLTTPAPSLGGVLPSTLLRDPHNGPDLVKQALLNSLRGSLA